MVALRKESVDRNYYADKDCDWVRVALRKESVDRNADAMLYAQNSNTSLSARRAWIEIPCAATLGVLVCCRSPQGERG